MKILVHCLFLYLEIEFQLDPNFKAQYILKVDNDNILNPSEIENLMQGVLFIVFCLLCRFLTQP